MKGKVIKPEAQRANISVIVCAFNEQATIGRCVRSVLEQVPDVGEILVVDGGNDGTRAAVEEIAADNPRVHYVRNEDDRGKGHAIQTGIARATGDVLAFFDADLQFYAADLPRVMAPIIAGEVDIVAGSRFLADSGLDERASAARTWGNRVISGYFSLLYGQKFSDVLAGTKALSRRAAEVVNVRCDSYDYEVEVLARGLRRGLRVGEVAISTTHREAGESKVSVLRIGLRLVASITRFRFEK